MSSSSGENPNIYKTPVDSTKFEDLTHLSAYTVNKHDEVMSAYNIGQIAESLSLNIPTIDKDVRGSLRSLLLPMCLFGEDNYDRRTRLKLYVAKQLSQKGGEQTEEGTAGSSNVSALVKSVAGTGIVSTVLASSVKTDSSSKPVELFYTEGSEELKEARKFICVYSLRKAYIRLKKERKRKKLITRLSYDNSVQSRLDEMSGSMCLLSSQVGDERPLTYGSFNKFNNMYAISSWSGFIKVWSIPECSSVCMLKGHTDRVNCVVWNNNFPSYNISAYNNDTKHATNHIPTTNDSIKETSSSTVELASCGADTRIYLWNIRNPKPLACLETHEDRVNRIRFHPSTLYLSSTSHDETVRLYDIREQKELLVQEGHSKGVYGMCYNDDGSLMVTGDMGGIMRVWDLRTGRSIICLKGHVGGIMDINFNSYNNNYICSCSDDNTCRIWDIRTRRCTYTLLAHNKLISSCMYEPTHGRYLLTSSYDNLIKVYNSTDLTCVKTLIGHDSRVMNATISSDGKYIGSVSFDRTWKLWNTNLTD